MNLDSVRTAIKRMASLGKPQSIKLPKSFNRDKKDLIDFIFRRCQPAPQSFADLGGVWGVEAAYTFYTLTTYNIETAFLIDTNFSDLVVNRAQMFNNLQTIKGNFGQTAVIEQIVHVDAIFLFDVLLHQVSPDWNEILQLYSGRTNYFVVFNQQWIKSQKTIRLMDMGKEEYFKNIPHGKDEPMYDVLFEKMHEMHPMHNRLWRDIHSAWQWGITDQDMLETMQNLGFVLQYYKNCGRYKNLDNFENHAFVFKKS